MNWKKLFNKKPSEKQYTAEEVLKIKEEKELILSKIVIKSSKRNEKNEEDTKTYNSVCTKCNGVDIVEKIVFNVKNNPSFLGSYTNTEKMVLNRCKTCDHEWEKKENTYIDYISLSIDGLIHCCRILKNLEECTFDPLDPTEKFKSLEEKRDSLEEMIKPGHFWCDCIDVFNGVSVDTILVFAKEYIYSDYEERKWNENVNKDTLKKLGFYEL